jgi:EAL domain-containing protein (putative c-di-GMP-specific phosphodiesterase class I)/CheY-like chemotaxis protein
MSGREDLQVMIAEDDPMQRAMVRAALEKLGVRHIVEADNGEAALARLAERGSPVDVALCDLQMPGMDGVELVRHLGESRLARAVIVMSTVDRSVLQAVESMASHTGLEVLGVIEKPATRDKIAARLASLARRPRAAGAREFDPAEIRSGLAAGHFEPFFQPKIALATNEICGVEALARWRHPDHDIVPPARFITAAERSGLINDLTWKMLDASLATLVWWQRSGFETNVALNLSLGFLKDPAVADNIFARCEQAGVAASRITFEITESMALDDIVPLLANLTRMRLRGFGLSIDDFGTGYASLEQLGRIPFTELKVDRAFVSGALKDANARAILESSLALGRRLNLFTVAEGVETEWELALLRKLPCDAVQGYHFAQPMDFRQMLAWALARRARAGAEGGAGRDAVASLGPAR